MFQVKVPALMRKKADAKAILFGFWWLVYSQEKQVYS